MKKSRFAVLWVSLWMCAMASAAPVSKLAPLSPYSPEKIPLQWGASNTLEDATYTIFYRSVGEGMDEPWEPIPALLATSATQGFFEGKPGGQYEFRSAVFSPQGSDMVTLADFDFKKIADDHYVSLDSKRLLPACSVGGFSRTFYIRSNGTRQGNGCYHFSFFSHVKDKNEIPADALIGLRFGADIPVRDWSPYNYLELYYWGNVPEGVDLWIESKKLGVRKPIFEFSQDGQESKQWHTLWIDLNELLGEPEARRDIQTLAFVKRIHDLDLEREDYEIRLDAIRLWTNRQTEKTRVDTTPPSSPGNVTCEVKAKEMVWTWEASKDEESDIAGYSYLFTQDRRKTIPQEILTQSTSVTLPYHKQPVYQEYFFLVMACNKAGVWSPITTGSYAAKP